MSTTISPITGTNIDGDLNSEDFESVYTMSSVLADLSETMTDWYDEAADDLETANDWLNWLRESTATNGRDFVTDTDDADAADFTTWLYASGFNVDKYFNHYFVNGTLLSINSKYKVSEVLELLSTQVETVSSDAEQVALFTEAIIDDYSSSTDELMNMIDTGKGAARGHIR